MSDTANDEACIVVTGNLVDGFFFYGPFENRNSAIDWAESEDPPDGWWIAKLASPFEER